MWCRELTYYEKWARSLAVILKERGTITQSELNAALGHDDEEAPDVKYTCAPVSFISSNPLSGYLQSSPYARHNFLQSLPL